MSSQRIDAIRRRLAELPQGSLQRAATGYVYVWEEDGLTREQPIKPFECWELCRQFVERRDLWRELAALTGETPPPHHARVSPLVASLILPGDDLPHHPHYHRHAPPHRPHPGRHAFHRRLRRFLSAAPADTQDYGVCFVSGVHQAEVTAALTQAIATLPPDMRQKALYIHARKGDHAMYLRDTLAQMHEDGFAYVFIDDATQLDKFANEFAVAAHDLAARGMKLVIASANPMLLRIINEKYHVDYTGEGEDFILNAPMLHCAHTPYHEYAAQHGGCDLATYLRQGSMADAGQFTNGERIREFVRDAIATPLCDILERYRKGDMLLHGEYVSDALWRLHGEHRLPEAVMDTVAAVERHFLRGCIDHLLARMDAGHTGQNGERESLAALRDALEATPLFAGLGPAEALPLLRHLTHMHLYQLPEPLDYLPPEGFESDREEPDLEDTAQAPGTQRDAGWYAMELARSLGARRLITQPGLRWQWGRECLEALAGATSIPLATAALDQLWEVFTGRLLRDCVLLDTLTARPRGAVVADFSVGGITLDMLVREAKGCHALLVSPEGDTAAFADTELMDAASREYGTITERVVLYTGPTRQAQGITFRNVTEYLLSLAPAATE